jgi:hypothetical protein
LGTGGVLSEADRSFLPRTYPVLQVESVEFKKGHKRSKNLRKKQRIVDSANNNQMPSHLQSHANNNTHFEEAARLSLLNRFGCLSNPFYYHTLLHPDLSSYQQAWRIVKEEVSHLLVTFDPFEDQVKRVVRWCPL